jgi:hypothetical protein
MIHMLQVLCGPERHAIFGALYDDETLSSADARMGIELLLEEEIAGGRINRRCEICGKAVAEFLYEDRVTKEQNWEKAQAMVKQCEEEQRKTREMVMAARRASRN